MYLDAVLVEQMSPTAGCYWRVPGDGPQMYNTVPKTGTTDRAAAIAADLMLLRFNVGEVTTYSLHTN